MGSKWIVVVRTATSSVTSETTVDEFEEYKDAQAHFDALRVADENATIIDAYLAVVHTEKH